MPDGVVALVAAAAAVSLVLTLLLYREKQARDVVLRFETRAGLPYDETARADAVRRTLRRTSSGCAGGMLGCIAGVVPLVAFGGWAGLGNYVGCATAGYGIATWLVHRDELRERQAVSPARTASLHSRRLRDYLTPVELVSQCLLMLAPAAAIATGVWALATDVWWAARAAGLVTVGVLGLLTAAASVVAQFGVVRAAQPAGSESGLRWEEAIRAQVLRELAGVAGATMLLAATTTTGASFGLAADERTGLAEVMSAVNVVWSWIYGIGMLSGRRSGWKRLRHRTTEQVP